MPSSKLTDGQLKKHFPTVYLTLVSILVALAIEGLLERMDQIENLFEATVETAAIWSQVALMLSFAATFWWVIARWASTLPWAFGFFDALVPLLLLVAFHFLATSIGTNQHGWFLALGVLSIGGAVNYGFSVRRALSQWATILPPPPFRLPMGISCFAGALFLALAFASLLSPLGPGAQVLVNALGLALLTSFAFVEYRAWTRAIEDPQQPKDDRSG